MADLVKNRFNNCSTCGAYIASNRDKFSHPLLGTLQCPSCHYTYKSVGDLTKYREGVDLKGHNEYCNWCLDGGELQLCSDLQCKYSFCYQCIERNFGVEYLEKMQSKSDWYCFVCDYTLLDGLKFKPSSDLVRPPAPILNNKDVDITSARLPKPSSKTKTYEPNGIVTPAKKIIQEPERLILKPPITPAKKTIVDTSSSRPTVTPAKNVTQESNPPVSMPPVTSTNKTVESNTSLTIPTETPTKRVIVEPDESSTRPPVTPAKKITQEPDRLILKPPVTLATKTMVEPDTSSTRPPVTPAKQIIQEPDPPVLMPPATPAKKNSVETVITTPITHPKSNSEEVTKNLAQVSETPLTNNPPAAKQTTSVMKETSQKSVDQIPTKINFGLFTTSNICSRHREPVPISPKRPEIDLEQLQKELSISDESDTECANTVEAQSNKVTYEDILKSIQQHITEPAPDENNVIPSEEKDVTMRPVEEETMVIEKRKKDSLDWAMEEADLIRKRIKIHCDSLAFTCAAYDDSKFREEPQSLASWVSSLEATIESVKHISSRCKFVHNFL